MIGLNTNVLVRPGFSDLMIVAAMERAGARPLYTFDRKAARLAGVELLR